MTSHENQQYVVQQKPPENEDTLSKNHCFPERGVRIALVFGSLLACVSRRIPVVASLHQKWNKRRKNRMLSQARSLRSQC